MVTLLTVLQNNLLCTCEGAPGKLSPSILAGTFGSVPNQIYFHTPSVIPCVFSSLSFSVSPAFPPPS